MILPTLGRPTLPRAAESIVPQLAPADELLIIADPAGDTALARAIAEQHHARYLEQPSDGIGRGGAQRTAGIAAATGSHLCFMDDDDSYLPEALALFREAACEQPVIFRVWVPGDHLPPPPVLPGHARVWQPPPPDRLCWGEPVLEPDNVSGITFLVPNRPAELGEWRGHQADRGCDYVFMAGCVETMGAPVWREEVVARIRA